MIRSIGKMTSETRKTRSLPWGGLFVLVVLSLWSLDRVPPLNFDEVGNMVMGHEMLNSGKIHYPLMHGVVDRDFELLTSSGQGSLRSVHLLIVGLLEKFVGNNVWPLRFFSVFIWFTIGFLFFKYQEKVDGRKFLIAPLLWIFLLDGWIASHLIRPDILFGFCAIVLFLLALKAEEDRWHYVYYIIGFIAGLSPGIHPHGLALLPAVTLIPLIKKNPRRQTMENCSRVLIGVGVGVLLWLLLCDFETYAISQHTYVTQLYRQQAQQWIQRLWPFRLIGDIFLMAVQPSSFYFTGQYQSPMLWRLSHLTWFTLFVFVIALYIYKRPKRYDLQLSFFGFIYLLVAIGFGHARNEFIYNVPINILFVPLLAWAVLEFWDGFSKLFEQYKTNVHRPRLIILTMASVFIIGSLFWVFQMSLIFYSLFIFLIFLLVKADLRNLCMIGGFFVFLFFSLYLHHPSFLKTNMNTTAESMSSLFGVASILISLGLYIFIRNQMKKERDNNAFIKNVMPTLISGLFILWCFGWSVANTAYHVVYTSKNTKPLTVVWKDIKRMIGPFPGKVLGPYFLWVPYGDSFRDGNGLVLDYFYSFQKRPWKGLKQAKPDIWVVDDEIRRRFLYVKDKKTGKVENIEIDSIIKTDFVKRGTIAATQHHSELDIYELKWGR